MKTLGILVLALMFCCSCGSSSSPSKYDTIRFSANSAEFKRAEQSFVYLVTTTKLKNPGTGKVVKRTDIGNAFVIKLPPGFPPGKYLLTADHVVTTDSFERIIPADSSAEKPRILKYSEKLSEETLLLYKDREVDITHRVIFKDKELDLALYKLPETVDIPALPFSFGNSDKLEIGNVVFVLGRPEHFTDINVREGIVSGLRNAVPMKIFEKYGVVYPQNAQNDLIDESFMLSAGINSGDSGLPVVASSNGRFEVVGICRIDYPYLNKIGAATRINVFLDRLKRSF